MLTKEIKTPEKIIWNYLKDSSKQNSRNLFIINQININRQMFDLLIIEINSDNDKRNCKLYFYKYQLENQLSNLKKY